MFEATIKYKSKNCGSPSVNIVAETADELQKRIIEFEERMKKADSDFERDNSKLKLESFIYAGDALTVEPNYGDTWSNSYEYADVFHFLMKTDETTSISITRKQALELADFIYKIDDEFGSEEVE